MKDLFQQVQDNFLDLGVLLSDVDFEHELNIQEIETISFALHEAYSVFNAGLCETAYMCEKCSSNRDQLHALLEMMKTCAKNGKMDRVANVALVEFMYIIPQVLAELRTVYLESFQKRQA